MSKADWIWMPHAGHFICGHDCRFRLNTYVNGYIVSTVGEYWPDRQIRLIKAQVRMIEIPGRGDEWDRNYFKKLGYEQIGYDRLYETMVFKAKKAEHNLCCPFIADHDAESMEQFGSYNTAEDAYKGHIEICEVMDKV